MDTPITVTLNKDDFLDKYPDVFSKLVWNEKQCVVNVWDIDKDMCVVSSAGAFGFVDIPMEAMKKYLTK